jgi:stearoyl-CoA desaturase (delta-9 desaturase)
MIISITLITHWFLSLFTQTFFLHRYSAHKMFYLNRFWERFFYVLTYVLQNVSFLNPRAYAILHRLHHAYSDTEKDPHSPHNYSNILSMMYATKIEYASILDRHKPIPERFLGGYPEWHWFDKMAESWPSRVAWMALFTTFYILFAPAWWYFFFLPIHFLMGPIHGAIVNWFGHVLGYRNHNTPDQSRNTLAVDFLMLGELFQNNHHQHPKNPNFGNRWFEVDPVYQVMRVLAWAGVIRYPKKGKVVAKAPRQYTEADVTAETTAQVAGEASAEPATPSGASDTSNAANASTASKTLAPSSP